MYGGSFLLPCGSIGDCFRIVQGDFGQRQHSIRVELDVALGERWEVSIIGTSARMASRRSNTSSQAVVTVSSREARLLRGSAHGRDRAATASPRQREPGSRTSSMKAAEVMM